MTPADAPAVIPAEPDPADVAPDAPHARPRWFVRCAWAAAHLALGYHLLSLTLGPATMRPASETQRGLFTVSEDYLNALYLNHGYHYFAPDPGPSTLLRYEGTRPDGTAVSGVIPDADGHFPRLLYHRHFMLTERLPGFDGASVRVRTLYHEALARGLGRQTGANELTLTRVSHRLTDVREARAGFGLDDPATYAERPLGTFDTAPPADRNTAPAGDAP